MNGTSVYLWVIGFIYFIIGFIPPFTDASTIRIFNVVKIDPFVAHILTVALPGIAYIVAGVGIRNFKKWAGILAVIAGLWMSLMAIGSQYFYINIIFRAAIWVVPNLIAITLIVLNWRNLK